MTTIQVTLTAPSAIKLEDAIGYCHFYSAKQIDRTHRTTATLTYIYDREASIEDVMDDIDIEPIDFMGVDVNILA